MTTSNPNLPALVPQADFDEIAALISAARQRAVQAVNTSLIELYWQVGQTISRKIGQAQWSDGVVAGAARFHPCESVSDAAVLRGLPRR